MKTFIAFRFSGEDPLLLEPLLTAIVQAFADRGVKAYCTFFDKAEVQDRPLGARAVMDHAFSIIKGINFLFVVQTSDNKSEGMLMEVGYCLAKGLPVIVATKDGVQHSYLPDLASQSLRWRGLRDLTSQIAHMPLS